MNNYYILQLNPQAEFDWERRTLQNPLTGERPDLIAAIAQVVNERAGSYLIKVNLEVEVLEQESEVTSPAVELPPAKAIAIEPRIAS